jgi:hypothetical protein
MDQPLWGFTFFVMLYLVSSVSVANKNNLIPESSILPSTLLENKI